MLVFGHLTYRVLLGGVFKGRYARFWFRISLNLMRAELLVDRSQTFLKYYFCLWFLLYCPLTSVYYISKQNARAFLKIFKAEVFHTCEKLPCYFPEQLTIAFL